ncbi:hypothetical protein BH11ARM2_BH11ARM2_31700 [soil metagenome]
MAGTVGTNLVLALQAVALVPLFVARIGRRLFGGWMSTGDALSWLQMLDLGMGPLLAQRMGAAQGREDEAEVGRWLGTGFAVMSLTTILAASAGWFLAPALAYGVGLRGGEASLLIRAFRLGTFASALMLIQTPFTAYCRGTNRQSLAMFALFAGSLVGFGLTVAMLLSGRGLVSIPAGVLARNAVQIALNGLQIVLEKRAGILPPLRFDRRVLREQLRTMPVLALSSIATLLATQGETLLVGLCLGVEAGLILSMTRRAVDVARSLVDSVAASTYGAFAHLAGSAEADRAPAVGRELVAIRNTLAVACAAGYIAVNPVLVPLWARPENYGGFLLTLLMGAQFLAAGWNLLVNSMLRATGEIVPGSWLLLAEAAIRLPLVWFALRTVGLAGLPAVTAVGSLAFGVLATRRLHNSFESRGIREPHAPFQPAIWLVRAGILSLAALFGAFCPGHGWFYVLAAGGGSVAGAFLVQLRYESNMGRLRKLVHFSGLQ